MWAAKALAQQNYLVDQHVSNMHSIHKRVDTAEKTAAAVKERLQATYARCSSLDRQVGERPKRLLKWFRVEKRAVDVECAQFMGDRIRDFAKDLVQFLMGKYETLNVCLGELHVLTGCSVAAAKSALPRLMGPFGTHAAVSA